MEKHVLGNDYEVFVHLRQFEHQSYVATKVDTFCELDCGSINNPSSSVQVWLIDAVTGKDTQIMMYSRHATYPEFCYYHLAYKPLKMCFGE